MKGCLQMMCFFAPAQETNLKKGDGKAASPEKKIFVSVQLSKKVKLKNGREVDQKEGREIA